MNGCGERVKAFFSAFYEEQEGLIAMIQISKDDAKLIREKMPNVPIKRTVHKYYTEEHPMVMKLLGRSQQRKDVRRHC